MRVLGLLLWSVLWVFSVSAQEIQDARYQIEVVLDAESHTLAGTQRMTYPNDSNVPLASLYFILAPNADRQPNPNLDPVLVDAAYWHGFDPAWLEIKAVFDDAGNALDWSYEDGPQTFQTYSLAQNLLRVELSGTLDPGNSTTVSIDFETKFPNRTSPDASYHEGGYTWRFAWNPVAVPATELLDGDYLSPQRPYYRSIYPAALYELTLTVPLEFEVASGMNVQEQIDQDDEAGTKTLLLQSEVPVRSVALSMGPKLKRYTLPQQKTPITVYYWPGEEAAARQIATYAVEVLEAYSARWGAYGYKQLTIVSSWASGLFGMAADGIVFLGNSAFSEKDLTVAGMADRIVEYVLAHEIAHQWWGIGVGTDFNAENFISEAFAEYLSITYFEDKYGGEQPNVIQIERQGLFESIVSSQLGYLNLRQHFSELPYLNLVRNRFDEALVKPQQDVESLNTTSTRVYNKGYLVLRALAGLIGVDVMDTVLLQAYQRFNHRLFDAAALQTLAEEISAQDLSAFFADWVYGEAFVDYVIEAVDTEKMEDGQYRIDVTLKRLGQGNLPVQVVLVTQDDEEIQKTWRPGSDGELLTFIAASPLKEIQVDPHSWTPDIARINNYFPTRLRIIPDGEMDVPLDAYLIRFDPLSQTVEGGFVLDYRWLLADGLVALVVNQGRGNTIDGALFIGEEILAEFGWNLTRYEHPNIGFTGQYWEPAHQLRLSLSRRLDFDERPINFAGISYSYSQLLTARTLYRLQAISDPFSFTRLSAVAINQTLLWPNITLQVQAQLGYSVGELPEFLYFTLAELNAFYDYEGTQKKKRTFPGRLKGFLRLDVNFPIRREMAYNVAGLALVRQSRGTLYVAAGETWDELENLSLDRAKIEAGFEATVSGQMFGGLLQFNVTAGLAMPLSVAGDQRVFEPYFRLNIPFL